MHLLVDAPVVAAVLNHISEMEMKYAWRRDANAWDHDDETGLIIFVGFNGVGLMLTPIGMRGRYSSSGNSLDKEASC